MSISTNSPMSNLALVLSQLDEVVAAQCSASLEEGLLTMEHGQSVDIAAVKGTILALMEANTELIEDFTSGKCYETMNPYRRQSVAKALSLLSSLVGVKEFTGGLPDVKQYLQAAGSKRRESYLVAVTDEKKGVLMQLYAKTAEEAANVAAVTALEYAGLENPVAQVFDKEAVPGFWLEGNADYIRSVIS